MGNNDYLPKATTHAYPLPFPLWKPATLDFVVFISSRMTSEVTLLPPEYRGTLTAQKKESGNSIGHECSVGFWSVVLENNHIPPWLSASGKPSERNSTALSFVIISERCYCGYRNAYIVSSVCRRSYCHAKVCISDWISNRSC